MPAASLPSAVPITVGNCTLDPRPGKCFTCSPLYDHDRVWISNGPEKRHLVLCFDGTGDSFDHDNSNVVQLLAMLRKDDPARQLVYYQAGIGTYTSSVLKTPILDSMSKLLDKMVAYELADHIKEGYLFLMQNYRAGDQICIFGFSRGAYTARALAGMLQKVGLLPTSNLEQLPFAYAMYAKDDEEGRRLSTQFKQTFSIHVTIKFLGVWDTVGSAGVIPRHLPFSGSNNAIVNFRHALSLDERRVKFIPFYCTSGKPKPQRTDSKTSEAASEKGPQKLERRQTSGASYHWELGVNDATGPPTNVKEVFFAGAHCDVGGGSVVNGERHTLARVPLRWMIRECLKLNDVGIIFDAHMLKHVVGLDLESIPKAPNPLSGETHHLTSPDPTSQLTGTSITSTLSSPFRWVRDSLSRKPSQTDEQAKPFVFEGEAQEELEDALSPIYDQLKAHTYWKVMEYIPWIIKKPRAEVEGSEGLRSFKFIWNRRKGRKVHHRVMQRGMKVHRSVKIRLEAQGMEGKDKRYLPKIRCLIDGKAQRPTRDDWLDPNQTFFEWVD